MEVEGNKPNISPLPLSSSSAVIASSVDEEEERKDLGIIICLDDTNTNIKAAEHPEFSSAPNYTNSTKEEDNSILKDEETKRPQVVAEGANDGGVTLPSNTSCNVTTKTTTTATTEGAISTHETSKESLDPFIVEILGVEEAVGKFEEEDSFNNKKPMDDENSNTSIDYIYQEQLQVQDLQQPTIQNFEPQQQLLLGYDENFNKNDASPVGMDVVETAAASAITTITTTTTTEENETILSLSSSSGTTTRQSNVHKFVHWAEEETKPLPIINYQSNNKTQPLIVSTDNSKSQKELMSDMTNWWGRSFQNKSGTRSWAINERDLELDEEHDHNGSIITPPPLSAFPRGSEPNGGNKRIQDDVVVHVHPTSDERGQEVKQTNNATNKSPKPHHLSKRLCCEREDGYCFGTVRSHCDALSLSALIFSVVLLVVVVISMELMF